MKMKQVVDANLSLALVLPLPYSAQAQVLWERWRAQGATVFVPDLWAYELASALRKAMVALLLPSIEAETRLETLLALGVRQVAPTLELHLQALRWAERTGQSVAYDGHYLALAETMAADFWTADLKLGRRLKASFPWIHTIDESEL